MRLRPLRTLRQRVGVRFHSTINARIKGAQPLRARLASHRSRSRVGSRANEVRVTATVHPFAGLGHQLSGMIAAELWARDLGVKFVPTRMPGDPRGVFFRETEAASTRRPRRLLITRDERDATSIQLLQSQLGRITAGSRSAKRGVTFALDQPRWDQTPASDWLRAHFLAGPLGPDLLSTESGKDYAAVHIRRSWFEGDISEQSHGNRWVSTDWYVDLLRNIRSLPDFESIPIRIYSLGEESSFADLSALPNVELWLNGDRDSDLVGLAGARLLVAAPSSFSFSAALISRGIVMAKHPWWHNVPDAGRWIRVSSTGDFPRESFSRAQIEVARDK